MLTSGLLVRIRGYPKLGDCRARLEHAGVRCCSGRFRAVLLPESSCILRCLAPCRLGGQIRQPKTMQHRSWIARDARGACAKRARCRGRPQRSGSRRSERHQNFVESSQLQNKLYDMQLGCALCVYTSEMLRCTSNSTHTGALHPRVYTHERLLAAIMRSFNTKYSLNTKQLHTTMN